MKLPAALIDARDRVVVVPEVYHPNLMPRMVRWCPRCRTLTCEIHTRMEFFSAGPGPDGIYRWRSREAFPEDKPASGVMTATYVYQAELPEQEAGFGFTVSLPLPPTVTYEGPIATYRGKACPLWATVADVALYFVGAE